MLVLRIFDLSSYDQSIQSRSSTIREFQRNRVPLEDDIFGANFLTFVRVAPTVTSATMEADAASVASGTGTTSSSTSLGRGLTTTGGRKQMGTAGARLSGEVINPKSRWNLGMVAIGNLKTHNLLASFYARMTSTEKKELNDLVLPLIRSAPSTTPASTRRRVDPEKEGGVLYFTTDSTASFLFCAYFRDDRYPERVAFALLLEVEHLVHEAVAQEPECSAKTGMLEKRLRQTARGLLAKYDNAAGLDKTAEVLKKTEDVKIQVRENLQKILRNREDLDDLSAKSEGLSNSAHTFHRTAEDAKQATRWSAIGMTIIGASFLLACIALFIFLTIGVVRGR